MPEQIVLNEDEHRSASRPRFETRKTNELRKRETTTMQESGGNFLRNAVREDTLSSSHESVKQ